MWGFLIAEENVPFVASLVLMLLIGGVEAVGLGSGLAGSDAIDGMDADLDIEGPSLLSWINVGRLPLLMLIVVFLFCFGMVGLIGQRIVVAALGVPVMWAVSVPAALAVALPATRVIAGMVARIMPRDETSAVSRDSLIGRVAVIVTGDARPASAAQARVRDGHGQSHYVMVEPDRADDVLKQGASVILVRRQGAKYYAIHNTSELLGDVSG
ncbi:YqiJ family protein [Thalassobaculum sp.]|uniref:YqiJ family protein n=1 Tax=Thalassobaculum sp. TaxID=2022740 RepID=UPI0032ED549A